MKPKNKYSMDNTTYAEFFDEIINEGENVHTAMVEIPRFQSLVDFVKSIPEEIVYEPQNPEYGKEMNPHITVLYGIDPVEGERAKALLRKVPSQIYATLGQTGIFETPQFDVLKIEVYSPYLSRINKFLRDNVEYENDFPSYKPHVTLCYLKKGMGKELVGDKRFAGMKFTFKTFLYSDENRRKESVPMTPTKSIKEIGAGGGAGGGYGGLAGAGGQIAASGWAGTYSSPQTSNRNRMYPKQSGMRDTMTGNTVRGIDPYDTITPDDLKHPKYSPDEIRTGFRVEMPKMQYPNKDIARKIVFAKLARNPKYYSDLHQYFDTET